MAANNFKENLIKEIELLKEQKTTIENDLKLILCQKEEIEIERDSFKNKYLKLNEFLLETTSVDLVENNHEKDDSLLKTFDTKLKSLNRSLVRLSVDELISKNKILTETNLNLKEELGNCKNNSKKYKHSITKDGAAINFENYTKDPQPDTQLITNTLNKVEIKKLLKSVDKILNESDKNDQSLFGMDSSLVKVISELKLIVESLIESLNDKTIAYSHQRKANKMLAARIQELEQQIELQKLDNINQNKFSFATTPATPSDRSTSNNLNLMNISPYSAMTMISGASMGLNLDKPLIPLSTYGNMAAKPPVKNEEMNENFNAFDNSNKNAFNVA